MKISVLGSYGEHNLGDEAILDGLIDFFQREYNASLVVYSHAPVKSAKIHKQKRVHFRHMMPTGIRSFVSQIASGYFFQTIRLFHQSDVVVIGGGGLFYEKELGHKGFSPLIIWFLRVLFLKLFLKKKYYVIGVGLQSLKKKYSRILLGKILLWAEAVVLRDKKSYEYAHFLCKRHKNIIKSSDLAWLRNGEYTSSFSQSLAIQIREVLGVDKERLKRHIIAIGENVIEQLNYNIAFYPMSFAGPDDRDIMKNIVSDSNFQNKITITSSSSPEKLSHLFASHPIILATRFHSIILSIQAGSIPIILSYSQKTQSLANDINSFLNSYDLEIPVHDIQNFSAKEILHDIKYILAHHDSLKKYLDMYQKQTSCYLVAELRNIFKNFPLYDENQ